MTKTHESSFEITSWEETDLVEGDVRVYRTDVAKRFSGDIEGTSQAWLVMTITPSGPAAYVGLEMFDVSVGARRGTFVLKHDATATSDGQEASWDVVSGSGTGELSGIEGTGQIERHEDGSHTFTLHVE